MPAELPAWPPTHQYRRPVQDPSWSEVQSSMPPSSWETYVSTLQMAVEITRSPHSLGIYYAWPFARTISDPITSESQYNPHFPDKDTKAQRGEVTCPR